jgi:hypothetical protein
VGGTIRMWVRPPQSADTRFGAAGAGLFGGEMVCAVRRIEESDCIHLLSKIRRAALHEYARFQTERKNCHFARKRAYRGCRCACGAPRRARTHGWDGFAELLAAEYLPVRPLDLWRFHEKRAPTHIERLGITTGVAAEVQRRLPRALMSTDV